MAMTISRTKIMIISIISIFIFISFILRALPVFQMDFSTYHILQDPDMWYNYRQIEVMVQHFPQYNWFDPMTAFPSGKHIDWGPAFPFFAAVLAIVTGATNRFDMMMITSWIPVIFALLVIPVLYYLGRMLTDWKTGVIAAIFIAVASGGYFYRSYVGVVDHHIAEVFFTALFSLFYIWAIMRSRETEISVFQPKSWKILLLPSVLAGVAFGIGLLTSPTCILFLVILGIYTLIQYIWNIFRKSSTDYLVVTNSIVSIIVIVFLIINGLPSSSSSLTAYGITQIYAFILFILGTVLLQILSVLWKEKPYLFIISVIGLIVIGLGIVSLVSAPFVSSVMSAVKAVFSTTGQMTTIVELQPWSLGKMWTSFNIGIILSVAGLILVIFHFIKKSSPAYLYVSVWAVWILILTILQVRWEYYAAVVISLLSAYALGYAFILDAPPSSGRSKVDAGNSTAEGKKKTGKTTGKPSSSPVIPLRRAGRGTLLVLVCVGLFCGISIFYDYAYVLNSGDEIMPPQWVGVLEWVQTGTPDPGVSYYGPYAEEDWQYPKTSYGILSWWDYGHWITFISQRIPVTNPFQDHAGAAASFFLSEDEGSANEIADSYGVKYVITDWQMKNAKFPAMIEWYNNSLINNYYTKYFRINNSGRTDVPPSLSLLDQTYYSTMISRLQNFDGSLAVPGKVIFIIYSDSLVPGVAPTITSYEVLNVSSAKERMAVFESQSHEGKSAAILGVDLSSPVENVSALRHYRLIYEETGLQPNGDYDFETAVKLFEYVPGAQVAGYGIIEAEIRTNLGRTFIYRQESENGWFILPYSTTGGSYPVTTVGPYHILSSGTTIDVTEDDVLSGKIIS
jgi:oligosaccharyl transferase (archaeosortase A-associated)